MTSLAHFIFFRLILRTVWIALLATFGIQLLFTFLPPKRVIDSRSMEYQKYITRKWTTNNYVDWVKDILKGDPQVSEIKSGDWLIRDFRTRSGKTLTLCGFAFLLAAMMGIFVGTTKATLDSENISGPKKPLPSIMSNLSTSGLFICSSVPAYIIAYFLFLLLKSESNMFLAVIALSLGSGSAMDVLRLTSNTHSRELHSKYVENALTCGLKTSGLIPMPGSVAWHAFRNSLITVLPITAYRLPLIVSSALVVEVVFDLPGLGESLLSSLIEQDVPMVLTIILISVLFVQICVFFADILAFLLHPQRYTG